MIFVTGGTGFIGAHLLMFLAEKGEQIKALKRNSSALHYFEDLLAFHNKYELRRLIEWVDGDLDDAPGLCELMKGCHTVYHSAGKVSFSEQDWPELLNINCMGTRNLVNSCLEAGVEKFCLFSSVAALDMSQGVKGKKPDWKFFRKNQPYGYSKYLAELEVYRGFEEGLKVLILNPAVVLGPSDSANPLSKFIRRLKSGVPFYPTGSTGFVSVTHLCKLAISCTDKLDYKMQITVCSKNCSYRETIKLFCIAGGFKIPTLAISGFIFALAIATARFFKLFGRKSSLSVSGLKAISFNGNYDTEIMKTHYSSEGQSIEEAIQEAVSFAGRG